jgi:hypothetical protein
VCLPGKEATIRGYSGVSLLLVDEASRCPDALYQACRPMLAVSGGRILLLSTPFGQRGFYFHEWREGGSDWERAEIDGWACPRISNAWLEEERRRIGDWWFKQEYCNQFVTTTDQVFDTELVRGALDPSIAPLFGNIETEGEKCSSSSALTLARPLITAPR